MRFSLCVKRWGLASRKVSSLGGRKHPNRTRHVGCRMVACLRILAAVALLVRWSKPLSSLHTPPGSGAWPRSSLHQTLSDCADCLLWPSHLSTIRRHYPASIVDCGLNLSWKWRRRPEGPLARQGVQLRLLQRGVGRQLQLPRRRRPSLERGRPHRSLRRRWRGYPCLMSQRRSRQRHSPRSQEGDLLHRLRSIALSQLMAFRGRKLEEQEAQALWRKGHRCRFRRVLQPRASRAHRRRPLRLSGMDWRALRWPLARHPLPAILGSVAGSPLRSHMTLASRWRLLSAHIPRTESKVADRSRRRCSSEGVKIFPSCLSRVPCTPVLQAHRLLLTGPGRMSGPPLDASGVQRLVWHHFPADDALCAYLAGGWPGRGCLSSVVLKQSELDSSSPRIASGTIEPGCNRLSCDWCVCPASAASTQDSLPGPVGPCVMAGTQLPLPNPAHWPSALGSLRKRSWWSAELLHESLLFPPSADSGTSTVGLVTVSLLP